MATRTHLTAQTIARMTARRQHLVANGPHLVIDGDVHPTDRAALPDRIAARLGADPNYFHGRPLLSDELTRRMDIAGIDMALCWQNPAMLDPGGDQDENHARLLGANQRIAALADHLPLRVIPAGWTDPKALGVGHAVALAQRCVTEFAMPVVKMNPAQNAYPIDDPMVLEVVDAIVELGAVPAFHFGADTPFTPTEGLVTVAKRHPQHPIIAVHMGGGGGHFVESEATYLSIREAGLAHPNLFFPISAKRDAHLASDLITYAAAGAPFAHNIAMATDTPYCDMSWTMGAWRALLAALASGGDYPDPRLAADPGLFDEAMVARIMGGNLADLIATAYGRILETDKTN